MVYKVENFNLKGKDDKLIYDLTEDDLYYLITKNEIRDIENSFPTIENMKLSQINGKHFYLNFEQIENLIDKRENNNFDKNINLYNTFTDNYKITNYIDINYFDIDNSEIVKIQSDIINEEFITDKISKSEKFYNVEIENSSFFELEERLYNNPFLQEFIKFDFVYRERDNTEYIQLYTSETSCIIMDKEYLEDTLNKYKSFEYENDFEL